MDMIYDSTNISHDGFPIPWNLPVIKSIHVYCNLSQNQRGGFYSPKEQIVNENNASFFILKFDIQLVYNAIHRQIQFQAAGSFHLFFPPPWAHTLGVEMADFEKFVP